MECGGRYGTITNKCGEEILLTQRTRMKFIIKISTLFLVCDKTDYGVICMQGAEDKEDFFRRRKKIWNNVGSPIILVRAVISDGDKHGIYDETQTSIHSA